MIRKLVLSLCLTAACLALNAQVDKVLFEKAVDRVNCRIMVLSLQSYNEAKHNKFVEACPCDDKVTSKKIIQTLTQLGDLSKTISLAEEIAKLKERYGEMSSMDAAIRFVTEDVFNNSRQYQKIYDFAQKHKESEAYKACMVNLQTEIRSLFAGDSPSPTEAQPVKATERQIPEHHVQPPPLSVSNDSNATVSSVAAGISFTTIFVAVVLSAIAAFATTKILLRKPAGISKEVHEYIEARIKSIAPPDNQTFKPRHAPDIKHVQEQVNAVELKLQSVAQQLSGLVAKLEAFPVSTPVSLPVVEEYTTDVRTEAFYLSTPNSDGSFNESSASPSYREGASIYRFTKVSNGRATFQIDERESSVKLALQYPNKNIDPVCEAENAYNAKAKYINTIVPGEAELVGGKWVNIKKAIIRYDG